MTETEILIPENYEITIGEKKYQIGKLSLKQVIVISKYIGKIFLLNAKRFAEYKKKLEGKETSNSEDVYNMLELLTEEEIIKLFGILLKEDDLKFIEDNLDFVTSTSIILKFFEANDWMLVKKNFQLIGQMLQPEKKEGESN